MVILRIKSLHGHFVSLYKYPIGQIYLNWSISLLPGNYLDRRNMNVDRNVVDAFQNDGVTILRVFFQSSG